MSGPTRPTVSPSQPVEPAHPLGVAGGQVVVDRDHVDALAGQRVQVHRQGRDEGLALAGLHLGDPPEVQRHARPSAGRRSGAGRAPARPPRGRRRRPRSAGRRGSRPCRGAPGTRPSCAELVVAQRLHLRLELVDHRDELGQAPDLLALAGTEELLLNTLMRGQSYRRRRRCRYRPSRWRVMGCVRLTWSLTPHSPAAGLAARRRRPPAALRRPLRPHPPVAARPRESGASGAGLTSKSHHARQPRVALRGSFRLRLASTFNHRPARSPPRCYLRPAGVPSVSVPNAASPLSPGRTAGGIIRVVQATTPTSIANTRKS